MSTQDIYNYRKVNDQISTGGQPTKEQLQAAAEAGFKAIINLATYNPQNSLADEDELVHSLDMTYFPIPVDWNDPKIEDFEAFEKVMLQLNGVNTLIHCAANFRVTAFYGLYAMKHLGWTEAKADEFRQSVWQEKDYPIWEKFIREVKARI